MSEIYINLHAPEKVSEWVHSQIPHLSGVERRGGYQAIGVERRGKLIGGFIFHDMKSDRSDIEMTAAGTGAFLNREMIKFLHWNAFDLLQVAHVTCKTSSRNLRAIKALKRAGFKIEGRQRKSWNGFHKTVLLGLIREDCHGWRRR